MHRLVLAVLAAFVIAYLLTPVMKKAGIFVGAVDKPNERKVHRGLITRIGGVAIYAGFLLPSLFILDMSRPVLGLIISGTMVMMLGLVDDIRGISPKMKLLGQIIAGLVLVYYGVEVQFITNPLNGGIISLGYLSVPVTVFWVIGVTNAVNLIDGLDGLAAGISAIAAVTLAVVAWTQGQYVTVSLALFLAAGALGFLRYNFHPAQLFMGDCGSMFLGFNLGALAVMGLSKGATVISLFIPVIILGIPILDTFFAIVRRFNNKKPIFQADKGHLHHCLLEMGLTHKQSVLVIYAITFLLGSSAVLLTMLTTAQSVLILIGISVVIIMGANRIGIITGRKASRVPGSEAKQSVGG
ncbi:MAG: MraY family glycosyltransferase [Desulfitobacteriaceae bacterium]|nr:MraY family glycosyltransferase [Desulfitobacteriaceae bacterium]MDD4753029.1 MraY family glycosyltransferase [Desulfitobacteriaceae bacterium]